VIFDGTIHIADYFFTPQRTGIPVGTTLNFGSVSHTATANDGTWDTGDIAAGQVVSVTLNQAGAWGYACTAHPCMIGQMVVRPYLLGHTPCSPHSTSSSSTKPDSLSDVYSCVQTSSVQYG